MKRSGQTVLWELWAALCLCTALVLPPGSPWLHEPALLYPGLSLAAVVPAAWVVWWVALPPQPLPERRVSAFSAISTSTPLLAAVIADCMPATPPPMMR